MKNRRISSLSSTEISDLLNVLGIPTSLESEIDLVFVPKVEYPTPYRPGRFGDGSIAVYYGSLDSFTPRREIEYHLTIGNCLNGFTYHYKCVEMIFQGILIDVSNISGTAKHLTSQGENGYPRCRKFALRAVKSGMQALIVRSARNDGLNIPIFFRNSLIGEARIIDFVRFS